jgi:hypothetical protein
MKITYITKTDQFVVRILQVEAQGVHIFAKTPPTWTDSTKHPRDMF